MGPAPGFAKEQMFFRAELIEKVYWFIQLRWVVVLAAFITSWTGYFLKPEFPIWPLQIIVLAVLIYNIVGVLVWRRLRTSKLVDERPVAIFAHVQTGLDLLFLFSVVYFTGGISSPLLMFVILHVILAGILFSSGSCFLYAILILICTAGLLVLEKYQILPHQPGLYRSPIFPDLIEFPEILVPYLCFAAAILMTAFVVTSSKAKLRADGKELLRVSKDLDASNAKLTALYEMVKEMGLCSDLQTLMDTATQQATQIMGVKGCAIKLLDEATKTLTFASTYGLSQDYLAKGRIDIAKSPINRQIFEGSVCAIGKIEEKDYFQYPEDIRREGISSMMCLPLKVEKKIFGIFCVYSAESYYFDQSDVDFFSLMTDLAAIAMENLRSGLLKLWFMMKASHQLRSPLNAVYTMLKSVSDGYLGPLGAGQKETIVKCLKRIRGLGDLINDLLKLGEKRSESARTAFYPVDPAKVIGHMMELHRVQAKSKGIDLRLEIQDDVPKVLANEKIIDELFANLISNAIKYTPPSGKVEVCLRKENINRLRFDVSDSGIGISEEEIPKLFTEFFRTEAAKAFVEEGTGLGLAIVKDIIDRLGGTIHVVSKLGEGTRFSCVLPSLPTS